MDTMTEIEILKELNLTFDDLSIEEQSIWADQVRKKHAGNHACVPNPKSQNP